MEITDKLVKEITETAYLNQENTFRYRPIMRFFYQKHEQAENWLYKEDIYAELCSSIPNYTIEDCQRDLDFLVSKGSLTPVQDTENATTLDKFKFNNFRYQMTDYAVEIERLTIRLEELVVKVASLEPRLFERIKNMLKKVLNITTRTETDIYEMWNDLITDFENLNFNYQDFIKKFHEVRTEELLQNEGFISKKNELIHYLEDFIKEYIKHSKEIKKILEEIKDENVTYLMDSLVNYQRKAPKIRPDFDYDYLREVNFGKWLSIRKWFISSKGPSEGERLLKATNSIISKITKYASSLIELHGNMLNRKEDYKYLCHLFDKQSTIEEAQKLASAVIGVDIVRHFKGSSQLQSDSIIPSLDVDSIIIKIDPVKRGVKCKSDKEPIKDKTREKELLLEAFRREEKRNREILSNFIATGKKELKGKVSILPEERDYIFKLLEKSKRELNKEVSEGVDPVFGKKYTIKYIEGRCNLEAEDGIFEMEAIEIVFGG